jgi:hypothetical protein
MDDDGALEFDEREALLRTAMQLRAKRWADSRGGLVALLNSLELEWPHVFAVPAGRLGAGTPRPWVPRDTTEKEILRAFKKASLQLHPDRLSRPAETSRLSSKPRRC